MKVVFFSTVFIGLLCYVTCGTCRNKKRQNMKQTLLQLNEFSLNENERSGSIIKIPAEEPPTSNDDIFGKIPQLLQKKIQDPSFVSYNGDTRIGGIPYNIGRHQIYNNGDSLGLIQLQGGKKRLVNKLDRPNKGLKWTDRSLISQIGVPKEGKLGVLQGDNRGLVGISGNVDVLQNGNRPLKRRFGDYNRNQRKFGVLKGLNVSLGYKKEDLAGTGIFGSDLEIIGVDNSTSEKDVKINKFNKGGIRILGDDQSRMEGDSDGPWTLGDNRYNRRDRGELRILGDNTYNRRDRGELRILGDNTYNRRDNGGLRILGDDTSRLRGDNDGSNILGDNTASINNIGGLNRLGGNSDNMRDRGGLRILGDNTYNTRDKGGLRILGDDTSRLRGDNIGSNTLGDNTASMNNNGGFNTLGGDTTIMGGNNSELRTLGDNSDNMNKLRGHNIGSNTPGDNTASMNNNSELNTFGGGTTIMGGNNGELRTLGDNTYSIRYNGEPGDDTSGVNSQSDGFHPIDYYSSYNGVSGNNGSNMNYDYMSSEEDDDDVLSLLDYGKNHKKRDNNRR